MSELEKMQRYIQLTGMEEKKSLLYSMDVRQMNELRKLGLFEMICLAFDYGKAKGFRMAKAEVREGGAA